MTIDLSPLYRNRVGYDRLASMIDAAFRGDSVGSSYPPYNIEVVDQNRYAITLAVAGFSKDELDIEIEKGVLSVKGKKPETGGGKNFLHQGIAFRSFVRKFNLAEHVEVRGADLKDGLLQIALERRVPEEAKPKRIEIGDTSVIENHQVESEAESQKIEAA